MFGGNILWEKCRILSYIVTYISEGRPVTGDAMITVTGSVEISPPKVRSKQGVILRYGDNLLGKIYQNVLDIFYIEN